MKISPHPKIETRLILMSGHTTHHVLVGIYTHGLPLEYKWRMIEGQKCHHRELNHQPCGYNHKSLPPSPSCFRSFRTILFILFKKDIL
jgi:hypothetical protein